MSTIARADPASDIILEHINGFTWHLVFGIEFSYSLEGLIDKYGVEYAIEDVNSYRWPDKADASFIDWDSSSLTFSMTDDIDDLAANGARAG